MIREVLGCGPAPARIMIIGEAPGESEERSGVPFCGQSGEELGRMLHDAGIMRSECYVTNVFKLRPPDNKIDYFLDHRKKVSKDKGFVPFRDRFIRPGFERYLAILEGEIKAVNPNVIICAGDTVLWAVTGESGITDWRGSVMPATIRRADGAPYKVVPTYHPAAVLRVWSWRFVTVHDLRRVNRESTSPVLYEPPYDFIVRPSFPAAMGFLADILSRLKHGRVRISVDIETRHRHIACIGFATNALQALCIPLMCVERPEGYWSPEEELELVLRIREVLTHPNAEIIGQNFIYDAQYIAKQWGHIPRLAHDTMLTNHLIFPGLEKRLDYLATMHCAHPRFWKKEGKEWDASMPEEQLWVYNCKDAVVTFEVAESQLKSVEKLGLQEQFAFQHSLWPHVLQMMLRGVRYDKDLRPLLAADMDSALTDRRQYFRDILGHELNPDSKPQMFNLFYGDLKQRQIMNRKTKRPTLDDAALTEIGEKEPLLRPLVKGISEWRSARVFKSTFIDASTDSDGRMRCSYNIAGTKTFRFSSSGDAFGSGMNLQNLSSGTDSSIAEYVKRNGPTSVPDLIKNLAMDEREFFDVLHKAEEDGIVTVGGSGNAMKVYFRFMLPNVRKLFIPDEGYIIIDMDLDRADLQVVIWEANDNEMKQMLREGVDVHSENAKVLHCSRQMAKIFVHGTNYGGSARTMAINCGITVSVAEAMQKRWFAAHPGIREWHRRVGDSLARTRSVSNAFGFRCVFFDRIESIFGEALAWTPQSTVALIINHALRNIGDNLPFVKLLLQVHDSLTFQVPIASFPSCLNDIRRQSLITVPYPDPLIVPVSSKVSTKSWCDCESLKKVLPSFEFAA